MTPSPAAVARAVELLETISYTADNLAGSVNASRAHPNYAAEKISKIEHLAGRIRELLELE